MDLSSLATHAQRLSARLAENLAERSKDLGLDAEYNAVTSSGSTGLNHKLPMIAQGLLNNSRLWDKHLEISSPNGEIETKRLLGSKHESERIEGLKRVLVMMCKNRSVLAFFPFVSNCLHSPAHGPGPSSTTSSPHSFTIRHLVSIYILQHAHLSPDLALLSVNAWQKDLSDPNPVIRSLALKTLTGMGLESVLPLVMLTINRLLNDSNWLVRRTVAESLIVVNTMDSGMYRDALIEGPLTRMLKDRSPLVMGSVLTAWEVICPNRWDLIHRQFRLYCRSLLDADENGQNVIMRLMTRYVREHIQDPSRSQASNSTLDPDLELLLNAVTVLLQSRNPSIVISATNVFLYLAPRQKVRLVVEPLTRLLFQTSTERLEETFLVVLHQIHQIILISPSESSSHLFSEHLDDFFVSCAHDSRPVKLMKVKILTTFVTSGLDKQIRAILKEFGFYVRDTDVVFVDEVIRAVGHLAANTTVNARAEAVKLLVQLTKDSDLHVVSASIEVLRSLLSLTSATLSSIFSDIHKLATELVQLLIQNKITSDSTRASIFWLLGESNYEVRGLNPIFIHVFKFAIASFVTEGTRTKYQILGLVAKSLIMTFLRQAEPDSSIIYNQKRTYQLGFDHVMRLARYDTDYDVRDRARYLLGLIKSSGLALNDEEVDGRLEISNDGSGGVQPISEEDAFLRGASISLPPKPLRQPVKLDLDVLKRIMFPDRLQPLGPPTDMYASKKPTEVNSLYRMLGLPSNRLEPDTTRTCPPNTYLSWNAIPAWTNLVLDSSVRDPEVLRRDEDQSNGQKSGKRLALPRTRLETNSSSSSSLSDEFYQQKSTRKQAEVVLVPTTTADRISSKPRIGGYANLDDFLRSSDEEVESGAGGSSEEETEDDEGEEEEEDDSNEDEVTEEQKPQARR
ncbi:hypothetical protein CROQUDRAFT_60083 [Cronartium quercuum f. sp. fusiforme G11]|uniref:Clathrin/coatomer adaptor adaptin-like N-terminal domain-containing protein n=1 Tax=Cronartium quercuum f. sp. fusiforme G11 TaxID=708437 RepID=A0A9P6NMT1_9BASI|nr:hypothetical protein CROQUDRAFT_60083 [Cronartium quercuum f. sp. fusiforme G11]